MQADPFDPIATVQRFAKDLLLAEMELEFIKEGKWKGNGP